MRLYPSDVLTRFSIDADHIAYFHKLRTVYFKARLRPDFLGHTGCSIASYGGFSFHDFKIHGSWNFNIKWGIWGNQSTSHANSNPRIVEVLEANLSVSSPMR